ncbi:probable basic-leucine zipper transcription factor J [Drosophila novamexicana]|uniref:probable basic-leucine zipper transcription factor J n=1 Tax=Drosophila novamexicana TaxID=47314 RepID=UPI0011E5C51C|nr:probable basic-leucine zipper transcription factor J [Drosophila novamexicana]
MELKVWVEGIQRIVCGVTVNTTCQDVVFALAHATGKVGRFTLIERWRNNERHLAPNENPMKLLLKWGEYANDVQFILQRSENKQQPTQQQQQQQLPNNNYAVMITKKPLGPSNSNNNNNNNESKLPPPPTLQKQKSSVELGYRTKELKKSFGGYDAKQYDNIGIVKGIPQQQQQQQQQHTQQQLPPSSKTAPLLPKHEKSLSNPLDMSSSSSSNAPVLNDYSDLYNNNHSSSNGNSNNNPHIYSPLSKSSNELRRASPNEYNNNNNNSNSSNEHLCDIYANSNISNNNNNNNNSSELYKQTPTISSNGALVPPPYRDPPPPRNSPMCQTQRLPASSSAADTISNASSTTNPFLSDYEPHNINNNNNHVSNQCMDEGESMFQATQYNDLLQLIKFQREKITAQQLELQKFDTEIVFLESRERDHAIELEVISREISKADQIFRQGSEQLQTLQYVEEENELVKQQEKTLKSEIALLRSKLANCETELLQCKNKMRLLMDDIELEQQQQSNRQTVERDFLIEMERIQSNIDQALHNTDTSNKTADNLKKELLMIEHAIAEKKRQVEQLVNEMKEVNLQSLTVTTTEEIKHLLEGPNKQGSSRRIIGSPRQLETAVPTSKNPHGVWV